MTADMPEFSGDLAADTAALAASAEYEATDAAEGRPVREAFLARHAEAVYDVVTANREEHIPLREAVFRAADRFPGLAPTREQLAAEQGRLQADKDGLEIDQGLLVHAWLRLPEVGAHLMNAMLLPCERALRLLDRWRTRDSLDLGAVLLERRGPAAHLTFRNTHCLNAEDVRLADDMETAVDLVLLDDAVRVGVLRGGEMTHPRHRGRRVFSAGINLRDLDAGRLSFIDFLMRRELGYVSKFARGQVAHPPATGHARPQRCKPWVAAVDSFAIGGGMQLLLVADRVIAADDAYFTLPAAREGIVPGVANLRLTRFTGSRMARRVILGGHAIRATDPEAALVCDEVVPAGELDAAVDRAVSELDSQAVVANRVMLGLAEEPPELLRAYLAEFARIQAYRLYDADVLAKVRRMRAEAS